jgi:hypothetical protein
MSAVATPSGLRRADLELLTHAERALLFDWTIEQCGGKNRDFIPQAVRRMPLETRLMLASDEVLTAHWQERERRRVGKSFMYFVEGYGHVQPPTGNPVPFIPWPIQRPMLELLPVVEQAAFPKARRMGVSWGGMHYVDWVCEHNPATTYARCLILSKGLDDAKEMLRRVKSINELQPVWLRREIEGTDNLSEAHFGNASVKSLPATPRAARSETATLVVLDEFAFVPNGKAGAIRVAVEPTVEGGGQIFYMSSGNGEVGDGAEFARICRDAERGENDVRLLFLPASSLPDRTGEFLEKKRASDARMIVEYAETLDEALQGDMTVHVYPRSQVAAAQVLGERLWNSSELQAMLEQGIEWGTDWGDFQTFTVYAIGLPGAGLYIIDELVQPHVEPEQASANIIDRDPAEMRAADGGRLNAIASRQDASPAGTNATFAAVLRKRRELPEHRGRVPEQAMRIPFGEYKQGGNDRGKANTIGFLRWLLRRTQEFVESGAPIEQANGVIAFHPRCKLLLEQMRNLERDPKTGKVKKPALDPKRPEIGDHGPDALVALASVPRAVQWTAQTITDDN